jgi:hypothetical protein
MFLLISFLIAAALGLGFDISKSPLNQNVNPKAIALSKSMQLKQSSKFEVQADMDFVSLCNSEGKLFGGGRSIIAEIGKDGKITKSFPTNIMKPSISPHMPGKLILGDPAKKAVFYFDTITGKFVLAFLLTTVGDPLVEQFPSGDLLQTGEMLSVASNGKHAFIAISAGFSSAIFKINPETKRIIGRAWAAADDPTAMTFHNGALFVMTNAGRQVRKFTDALELSHDKIEIDVPNSKGLAIRDNELTVLTNKGRSVTRFGFDTTFISFAEHRMNLDRIRNVAIVRKDIGKIVPQLPQRYAVLICGDLAENFTGECFWNDTIWMFKALIANGYTKDHIYVLYGDGSDFASTNANYQYPETITNFAATPSNVNMVLDGLKNGDVGHGIAKMKDNDTLFLWTFDHGSSLAGVSYLCLRGGNLSASTINDKLNAIPYAARAIFMQQCFSGGFIPGLKNSKTFISTACQADEVAHPGDDPYEFENVGGKSYSHGEYNFYVTSALNRLNPSGVAVIADSNMDTWIASLEMHNWDAVHKSRPEHPQMDNSGGVGDTVRFKK